MSNGPILTGNSSPEKASKRSPGHHLGQPKGGLSLGLQMDGILFPPLTQEQVVTLESQDFMMSGLWGSKALIFKVLSS